MILRIFRLVISKLEELFDRDTPSNVSDVTYSISPDDYKECNYLLRTTSNVISTLSHTGWVILLTQTLGQAEKRPDALKSEGRCCLEPV